MDEQQAIDLANGAAPAIFGGIALFGLVFLAALYVYFAVCFMTIAKRTNTANGWLAWIPIVNIFLMATIAGKPWWWGIFMFIPLVNIVVGILLFMEIAKRLGKPEWVGVLMIVPFINIFVPGYLAFAK